MLHLLGDGAVGGLLAGRMTALLASRVIAPQADAPTSVRTEDSRVKDWLDMKSSG